jgi:predicted MPP superfamily phosphohydrolase
LGAALVAAAVIAFALFLITGYREATARPIVRVLVVGMPKTVGQQGAVRLVLFSDLHVHGPDMPPARVSAIVEQINALHPDVVVSAGDFMGDSPIGKSYSIDEAIAPLALLRAKYGVFAVLGNHDYEAGASALVAALKRAHVRVLLNDAVEVGPLAIGGVDGSIDVGKAEWKARRARTYAALGRTPGFKVLIAHRPDEFTFLPPSIGLLLAGHTHCGQIVLPLIGALETGTDYGRKYLCGVVHNGSRVMVVTAGLGTSHVPLRIGAPPDIWAITIRPD